MGPSFAPGVISTPWRAIASRSGRQVPLDPSTLRLDSGQAALRAGSLTDRLLDSKASADEDSRATSASPGQGSGEGGRGGLRHPAPWSLAQGLGVVRSPQSSVISLQWIGRDSMVREILVNELMAED